jgi:exosortase/archaeosortase family protein
MTERWKSQLRRCLRWRTLMSVGLAAGVIVLMIWTAGNESVMSAIQGSLARITGGILTALGQRAVVEGNTVRTAVFGISVVTACTGLFTAGLFLIAVLIYPAGWRSKLVGVGIGLCGILALNVVRLVSLYFVGVHFPSALEPIHLLVWQSLLIAFAVSLWLFWAGRLARAPREG